MLYDSANLTKFQSDEPTHIVETTILIYGDWTETKILSKEFSDEDSAKAWISAYFEAKKSKESFETFIEHEFGYLVAREIQPPRLFAKVEIGY